MIEAAAQGQAGADGRPNTTTSGAATRPDPTAIRDVVVKGSSPNLMTAFHAAWQAAANSTAAKTMGSMRR